MSRLIKRKTTSGAPTPSAPGQSQEQSISEVIRTNFTAWAQSNFPDELADPDASHILLSAYMGGLYRGEAALG